MCKETQSIGLCISLVSYMQRLAHRHVKRLYGVRTWRRAQVVTAWCHGHGIGDMAGCKTAQDVCQADGCAGPAAQRLNCQARRAMCGKRYLEHVQWDIALYYPLIATSTENSRAGGGDIHTNSIEIIAEQETR